MANINAPFGFRQLAGNGSSPTFEQVAVSITNTAGAIYSGDPVTLQNDGSVAQSASTGSGGAALGIAGVFQGCKYLSVSQKRTVWSNYWPGSDAVTGSVEGYIVNDPNAKFLAQSDATGLAAVDVNMNIGFVIGSGTAANGQSGAYLDVANMAATANLPFKILSLLTFPPGGAGTLANGQPYDWAVVAFNNVNTRNFTGV